jgi:hypothetical protein
MTIELKNKEVFKLGKENSILKKEKKIHLQKKYALQSKKQQFLQKLCLPAQFGGKLLALPANIILGWMWPTFRKTLTLHGAMTFSITASS